MLLLTTPDYLPKLGGLTSHTLNVEKVLRRLGIAYEVFHWKNYQEIIGFAKARLARYEAIINIHSGFHMYMPSAHPKVINFINGAEMLFYSPNVLKQFVKTMTKPRALRKLETAYLNVFISNFTFQTVCRQGLVPDYSRDVIFPMMVDTTGHRFVLKDLDAPLKFVCVARDVPHKNFAGAISFCEVVQEISGRSVEFLTVTNKEFKSDTIRITSHVNPSNEARDKILSEAHFNVLFSLDHSHRGFFEGFGQIVQEAGMLGTPSVVLHTGGLPESVHHQKTGWVLRDLSRESVSAWWHSLNRESYEKIAQECYDHTVTGHGLDGWENLFRRALDGN